MTQTTIPNLNETAVTKENTFGNAWQVYLQALYKAIRARFSLNLSGMLSVNTSPASNSGSGETDLMSYTLDAETMKNNGDILTVRAWGTFAANGNNKTLKLKFGSQTILDTGAIAANSGSWEINATIVRISPTTQEIIANIISSNSSVPDSATRTAGTQDLTTTLIVKCTGLGGATTDLTQNCLIIGLTPND